MRAYQIQQIIPASHTLTMHLPPEVPAGPAQVIVLYPEPSPGTLTPTEAGSVGIRHPGRFRCLAADTTCQWSQSRGHRAAG